MEQKPTIRPFQLNGDSRGVLCIHGFTGSPFEVQRLADHLHKDGRTVRAMLLPGHGTHPDELNRTFWREWVDAVHEEVRAFRSQCEEIAVVGQSLGGLLALNASIECRLEISAVVSLAAPLWLDSLPTNIVLALKAFPFLQRFVTTLPKLGGSDIRDPEMKAANPSYPVIPTKGLIQLDTFMKHVRGKLDRITAPLLVTHSKQDHTAPFDSALEIYRRSSSADKHLQVLEESFHLVAFDTEYRAVAKQTSEFFAKALGWSKHQ